MKMNRNGVVLWGGPSRIDGAAIVAIATGLRGRASANAKTGALVQTWILRADRDPLDALRTGADISICGGCIHRPRRHDGATWSSRSCYVNVAQAPLNIWRTWKRGRYGATWDPETFQGRKVRLGSYGDPAAVPAPIWADVLALADGWTGYTHQARRPDLRDVLQWCQVSADSCADAERARSAGLGSFRVLADSEEPEAWETLCPASAEAGKLATCADCMACHGIGAPNIAIRAHGIGARHYEPTNRRALPVLS